MSLELCSIEFWGPLQSVCAPALALPLPHIVGEPRHRTEPYSQGIHEGTLQGKLMAPVASHGTPQTGQKQFSTEPCRYLSHRVHSSLSQTRSSSPFPAGHQTAASIILRPCTTTTTPPVECSQCIVIHSEPTQSPPNPHCISRHP